MYLRQTLYFVVGTRRCRELLSAQFPGTDVIPSLQVRFLLADLADGIDTTEGLALGPIGQIDDTVGRQYRGDLANQSAMGFLDLAFPVGTLSFTPVDERGLDRLQQSRLIGLDHQQVIPPLAVN